MKMGLYSKLAFDGMKKNGKLYVPYIITGIGMVAMSYIIAFLSQSEQISGLKGGSTICSLLEFGQYILLFFSALFLFYSNSFLMKRRNREFGLYNIMGMSKKNISKIVLLETLFMYLISLLSGLLIGVIMSKAAELVMIHIMHGEINSYAFTFTASPFITITAVFGAIFFLLLLNSLRQISVSNPIALLHSENAGEKKPKANWLFGLLGAVILAVAYYIAIATENPIDSILFFFIAVILVIIATYLLFMAGSVLLCHLLKKNKNYYYKPNHFFSVSSMMFRMKRNGAGLASICILATMVLVMMTGSSSLYFGSEDSMRARYPYEIEASFEYNNLEILENKAFILSDKVDNLLSENNFPVTESIHIRYAFITGMEMNGIIETDSAKVDENLKMFESLSQFAFINLEDYNYITGEKKTLNSGEALLIRYKNSDELGENLNFGYGVNLNVVGEGKSFFVPPELSVNVVKGYMIVIKDFNEIKPLQELADYNGNQSLQIECYNGYNTTASDEVQVETENLIAEKIFPVITDNGATGGTANSIVAQKNDYYGTYGGIFFLGIVLSLVFMFATVMIIYYKQITEGYEDVSRYEIMKKVGMTNNDIKKTINSQMLTVFFAPIIMAVMHLAFAFPMMRKLLLLFGLSNLSVILFTTAITAVVFMVFYAVVYKITSHEYYRIVSGNKK